MKRKLENPGYPQSKRQSTTLFNSISTTLSQKELTSIQLQDLIVLLEVDMSFDESFYLLKQLAHRLNTDHSSLIKKYREHFDLLANLAFKNIQNSFKDSDSIFNNWASHGRVANKISYLIYDLGLIASEFDVPSFEAQDLEFMLSVLFENTTESNFFGRAFFGIGLLANKTIGRYDVEVLETIIDKVSSNKEISALVVENFIRGLCLLSQEKRLTNRISANLLNKLLAILCELKIDKHHLISLNLSSLTIICKHDYLEGKLDASTLEILITQLAGLKNLTKNAIKQTLHFIEILVHHKKLEGVFDLNCLESVLQPYSTESPRIEISDLFCSLGKILHSKQTKGKLSPPLIAKLANCFDLEIVNSDRLADFMYGYISVIKELGLKIDTEFYHRLQQFKSDSQFLKPYFVELEKIFLTQQPAKISIEMTTPTKQESPQPKKNSPLMVRAIKKRPSPIHSPVMHRILKEQQPNQLIQRQLAQANKNEIYKTIAEQNIQKLLNILNLPITVLNEIPKIPKGERQAKVHSKSSPKKVHSEVDKIVIEFFKQTGNSAFQHLLKNTKSTYFYCIFKACNQSVLFELAKAHELNPLLVHLPMEELKKLVTKLMSPLQIYRDCFALLNLIDGLTLRGYKNPEEREELKKMKKELMITGIEYHSRMKNNHVEQLLRSCPEKMEKDLLLCPDNKFYKSKFIDNAEDENRAAPTSLASQLGIFANSSNKNRPLILTEKTGHLAKSLF